VTAVDCINLEIKQGEFFTLLGSSGCGKTTTLRMIGGLEKPEGGEIHLGDQCLVSADQKIFVKPEKRDMGMVFQSYALWPHMTVFENVAYPLKLRSAARSAIRAKVEEVLGLVGLSGLEDRPAPALSGGQQQRVAIARALINEPVLILADEPTGALDSRTSVEIMALFQDLNREGITIVVVTHEPDIARYAHRILSFRDGHLTRDEPVAERLIARELLATLPGGAEPAEEEDAETEVTPS